jgi:hypothetical protein
MHSLNIGRVQFPGCKFSVPNHGLPGVTHTTGTQGALKISFYRNLTMVLLMGNSASTLNNNLLILSLPKESSANGHGCVADLFVRCTFLLRPTLALRFCDGISASGAFATQTTVRFSFGSRVRAPTNITEHGGSEPLPRPTDPRKSATRFSSRWNPTSRKLFRRILRRGQIDELRTAVGPTG